MKDSVDTVVERWTQDGLQGDRVTLGLFTRMAVVVRGIADDKAEAVDQLGLQPWVVATVYALRRRGRPYRAGPTELAAELAVTQAAMTSRIKQLVGQGHVTTARDPDDGRRVVVTLTAEGHRLTERIVRRQLGVEDRLLSALDPAQRAGLDSALRVLFAAYENDFRRRHDVTA